MRRVIWALGLGGLLSLGVGCSNQVGSDPSGTGSSAIASSPSPSSSANFPPDPALASVNVSGNPPGSPVATPAAAAANTLPEGTLPESLISKTDPLRRLPQVRAGRSNPFASLAVNPRVVVAPAAPSTAAPAAPQLLQSPRTLTPAVQLPLPSRPLPNGALPTVAVAPTGAAIPAEPAIRSSSLARQIRISGAVHVGDRLSIIVEVPNEHTSRPVSVGDYIGNGSVLVKRIEMRGSQEPRVIFEENGVEVVREVGDVSPLLSAL